jgi:hypothetical protein
MLTTDEIDIAYKYPFSEEAKRVIAEKGPKRIEYKYLELGKDRVEAATNRKQAYFKIELENVKLGYVISYIYARMLVSASSNAALIRAFASGEARRSGMALKAEPAQTIMHIASQLSYAVSSTNSDEFIVSFSEYLMKAPKGENYALVNMKLKSGFVILDRNELSKVLEHSIYLRVLSGLPIPKGQLPKELVDYYASSKLKLPESASKPSMSSVLSHGSTWIDEVLATPIPDVRHRTVNLVLAPYLVNVKGLGVDEATDVIKKYIEECKQLNPNTDVSETYIRYQCNYSKNKGMRPLSLSKAKELLGEYINFDSVVQKPKAKTDGAKNGG